MNIAIVSHFRNAVSYIERYCEQMDDLQNELAKRGHSLTLILGYGDSTDDTRAVLFDECCCRFDAHLYDVSHGGHHYGSIVHPERFKQLALVGNALWQNIPLCSDIVGLVESDLIWRTHALTELIVNVAPNSIIAPMVYHQDGRFYDTWAFRSEGRGFKNEWPFHPMLTDSEVSSKRFYEMESVGSCIFMRGDIARQLCWPEKDVIVGFCALAKQRGARIVLDSFTEVYHP